MLKTCASLGFYKLKKIYRLISFLLNRFSHFLSFLELLLQYIHLWIQRIPSKVSNLHYLTFENQIITTFTYVTFISKSNTIPPKFQDFNALISEKAVIPIGPKFGKMNEKSN